VDTRPFFLGQVGPGNEAILRHLHGAGTGLLAQAMRGGVVEVSEATCIVYAPYGESVLPIRKILNICDRHDRQIQPTASLTTSIFLPSCQSLHPPLNL